MAIDQKILKELAEKYDELFTDEKYEILEDGVGSDLSPEDVDEDELAEGVEVEMEHTSDELASAKIAIDHLEEIPDYYTRLAEMEEKAEEELAEEEEEEAEEKEEDDAEEKKEEEVDEDDTAAELSDAEEEEFEDIGGDPTRPNFMKREDIKKSRN